MLTPVTVPAFAALPWLIHGFSTRAGGVSSVYQAGDLNLGFTPDDDRETVQTNRARMLATLTAPADRSAYNLVTMRQTHSATVHRVERLPGSPAMLEGDGLVTNEPGLLLGILTADCVPVLAVDPHRRAVAAFHAGWRGTVQQIVEQGIARMRAEFGSEPHDLFAAVGPAIGACCYTVGDEVRQRFGAEFAYADQLFSPGKDGMQLDLAEANRRQLLAAGLGSQAITMLDTCTACHTDRFFSHRAEDGVTGRMMAVIGVRPA